MGRTTPAREHLFQGGKEESRRHPQNADTAGESKSNAAQRSVPYVKAAYGQTRNAETLSGSS